MIGRDSIDFMLSEDQKLQLEVWYPAESSEGEPDYELYPELRTELSEVMGIPKIALSLKAKTKGLRGLEPAKGAFPIIIFSHGFASFSRQNTKQFEALVEAGYIVLSVSHPGQSLATRFDDGSIVPLDSELLKQMTENLRTKKERKTQARAMNLHGKMLVESLNKEEYLANLVLLKQNTMYGDYPEYIYSRSKAIVDLVLNIDSIDASSMAGADLQSIGLYGHSLGGMVSVYAAGELSKLGVNIKSVVSLDAVQIELDDSDLQISTPTCFVMGGSTKLGKSVVSNLHANRYLVEHNDQVCEINIAGAAHHNFTDLNSVGMLKWFGMLGPINNKKFGPWLTGFLVNYFDLYVKSKLYDYAMLDDAEVEGQIAKTK